MFRADYKIQRMPGLRVIGVSRGGNLEGRHHVVVRTLAFRRRELWLADRTPA